MTPPLITQWLQQPHQNIEPDTLQELQERYPYFTPFHYMDAAIRQKKGEAVQLSGNPHLYSGNRVLFFHILQQASMVVVEVIPELPAEHIPVAAAEQEQEEPIENKLPPDPGPATEELTKEEAALIQPVFTEDYFLHQGIPVDDKIPAELDTTTQKATEVSKVEDPKSLMVVMSFTEWLMHFKSKTQKEKEEEEDRKAVKHMWQKEKLAAALEEEDDEIPENVFEMAVNSISKEDGLVSESLAEVLAKQGKWEKAIEMYRKLSLRNPQKSAYFAQQIVAIQKKSE